MTDLVLQKTATGALAPVDAQGIEYLRKLKIGQGVKCTVTRMRNLGFHKKFFALLNLAFDAWDPEEQTYKGQVVQKEFDQFRNDVTVMAGYYESSITLKGEVRLRAKSISFHSMDQDEFEKLYNAIITVVLEKILTNYTRADLDRVVQEVLGFT